MEDRKQEENNEELNETLETQELKEEKIEQLDMEVEKKMSELESRIKEMQDKLLRAMAECENIRIRSAKQVEDARNYAVSSFAKDLVSVMDNFDRAIEHADKTENMSDDAKNLMGGVKMTKTQMESVFKTHGLESIRPQPGENFDYNLHAAISQIVTEDAKEGTIVEVVQTGYKISGRLIRPAGVIVAKTS